MRKVEYLGYMVEGGTVRPSETKSKVVKSYPKPKTQKEVPSFVGLTSYFRKFILQYATIARPLTQLLKECVQFEFGTEQKRAFEELKTTLTREPVLKL